MYFTNKRRFFQNKRLFLNIYSYTTPSTFERKIAFISYNFWINQSGRIVGECTGIQ